MESEQFGLKTEQFLNSFLNSLVSKIEPKIDVSEQSEQFYRRSPFVNIFSSLGKKFQTFPKLFRLFRLRFKWSLQTVQTVQTFGGDHGF